MNPLRHFLRQFKHSGLSMGLALVSFSLGLGLVIAQLGLINGVWINGLPFEDADRLVTVVRHRTTGEELEQDLPALHLKDYREKQTTLEALYGSATIAMNLVRGDTGLMFWGAYITPGLFETLGVKPILGRTFVPDDLERANGDVVILGHELWTDEFARDPEIFGRSVMIEGKPRTVVGVMPPDFQFPYVDSLWLPLIPEELEEETGWMRHVMGFGRLNDGVSRQQAQLEFSNLVRTLGDPPDVTPMNFNQARVRPLIDFYLDDYMRGILFMMATTAVLVLLVACANASNLQMARLLKRGQELAIRSALGASRARIIRQVLGEMLTLGLVSLVAGWALAWIIRITLEAYLSRFYWADFLRLDFGGWHFPMVVAITLLTVSAAGIYPALRASGADIQERLKEGSRSSTQRSLSWVTQGLIIAQVAFSFTLLSICAILVFSVQEFHSRSILYRDTEIVTGWLGINNKQYPADDSRRQYFHQVTDALEASPLFERAAHTSRPGYDETESFPIRIGGVNYMSPDDYPNEHMEVVSEHYFEVVGAPILQGRGFVRTDVVPFEDYDSAEETPAAVTIVNQSFARKHWPDLASPLDQRVFWNDFELRVIGVVPDLDMEGVSDAWQNNSDPAGLYILQSQGQWTNTFIVARTRGPAHATTEAFREIVTGIDPSQRLQDVMSMEAYMAEWTEFDDFLSRTFLIMGLAALLIALAGLYSVIAYSMEQRRSEFAIRLTLGARPGALKLKEAGRTGWKIVSGVVLGVLFFALARSQFTSSLPVVISPVAPLALVGACLIVVCLVAASIPVAGILKMNLSRALHEA